MRVSGYNTWLYKYIAFVFAGTFAGVAGILLAYHNGAMVPSQFAVLSSGLVLLMVIMGGAGTLYGPVIGVAVIILLEFYASTWVPDRWPLILGGVFVVFVMYARAGFAFYLSSLWKKVLRYGSLKG
jgi:branched-chain amino acid transport system permease protein